MMGQAHQAPFTAELLHAAKQKSPETSPLFDLTTYRFNDHLAPGVQRTTCRALHLRRHLCFGRAWRLRGLCRQGLVPRTPRRSRWIEPQRLQRLGCRLAVIATVPFLRDRLGATRFALVPLVIRPRNVAQCPLVPRYPL